MHREDVIADRIAAQTHGLLEPICELLRRKYAHAQPSLYLHGSRGNGSAQAASDLDISVVLPETGWIIPLGNDLDNLRRDFEVQLDATVYSIAMLNTPGHGYDAGRVLRACRLVQGVEVRGQITPEFIHDGHTRRTLEQAHKGIALLRGLTSPTAEILMPSPSLQYFGYEIVRKPSWYPEGVERGTKELVAASTWCASAWLSVVAGIEAYSKKDAVERFSEKRPSSSGEVVAGLWNLCREKLSHQLPETQTDAEHLRRLCVSYLALEREIAGLQ